MLQRKREQFHTKIRRQHIQRYQQKIRKQFMANQQNFNHQCVNQLYLVFQNIRNVLKLSKNEEQSSFLIKINLQKLSNFSHRPDNNRIATYCMNNPIFFQIFLDIFAIVYNQTQLDQQDDQKPAKTTVDINLNLVKIHKDFLIIQFVNFLKIIEFFALSETKVIQMLNKLWNIFSEDILYNQYSENKNNQFECLENNLQILKKILILQRIQIFNSLVDKGLGSQIVKMIDRSRNLALPLRVHQSLVATVMLYLANELKFPPQIPHKIGGIYITTKTSNQKQILLAYCLCLIDKNQKLLFPIIFKTIHLIFEVYEFLAGNLSSQFLRKICYFILDKDRQISNQALSVLNDLVYFSQENADNLLENNYLLDVLYNRLIIQKNMNDQFVNKNVQAISYIVCNTQMTPNRKLIRQSLNHHIWQEIYGNLFPDSKLFPTIMTIKYFLYNIGHKNFDKFLIPLVEAIQNYEWTQSKYASSIHQIFELIFQQSQYWQQHEANLFYNIMRKYKLIYLFQDRLQQMLPEDINDIEIQN